jgi:hypothetical protein
VYESLTRVYAAAERRVLVCRECFVFTCLESHPERSSMSSSCATVYRFLSLSRFLSVKVEGKTLLKY